MILFLIGFMGSGKTTLGKRLAKKLEYEFADMDEILEAQEGMCITDIFKHKGEAYFRELETGYINKLDNTKNMVLATGGGAPCFGENMNLMNQKGITIYLKMTAEGLAGRLENAKQLRPLIAHLEGDNLRDFIADKLLEREKFYLQSKCVIKAESVRPEHVIALVFGDSNPFSNE